MKRTGFTPKKTWKRLKRTKRVNPVSAKRKKENHERAKLPVLDYCEAKRAGAPRECFGALHLHEIVSRARGGSITDPDNMKTVCDEHNRLISQDADVMQWAYKNDFLRHGWG